MTGICLRLDSEPDFDIDASVILPETVAGKSIDKIKRIPLMQGNRRKTAGDLFEIDRECDNALEFHGATDKLRRIGSGMTKGVVRIMGNAGNELGADMTGGEIHVSGNAGDYVGSGMRGGKIEVRGNTGDFTAGALPSAALGMRDGVICVGKNVGMRAGDRMRRGLLVVSGDAGPYCGSNIIAGTVVVTGQTAAGIGSGMRRGTILLLNEPNPLPTTFNECGTYSLAILALLLRYVRTINRKVYAQLRMISEVRRLTGDIGCDGQGEILIAFK
ncbi:MAG: formylmethanofuran dehydrogenase subunit C [Gammaproteobacteria bacterium]